MQLIIWRKRPKDTVQCIKEDAAYAAPSLGAPLCHATKIIDVDFKTPKWSPARL
jgi:hypothetical protein